MRRTKVVRRMSLVPRSTRDICTAVSPDRSASVSWVQPRASRAVRTRLPKAAAGSIPPAIELQSSG